MTDMVNKPPHYQSVNGVECIDAIRSALNDDELFIAHCRATALKYTWRAGKKVNASEDLKKAIWYLMSAVELLEQKGE